LAVSIAAGASWEEARTVLFIALVVAHLLYAFVVRLPADGNFFNGRLVSAVGIGLLLQVGTVLGPFQDLFEVVPLSPEQWLLAIGAGTVPVVVLGVIETLRHRLGQQNPAAI
jgi:hypothetical protein